MQVAEATHKYARGTGLAVVPLYGGASMPQQIRALERGADIVVATPGRALDHIRRRSLALDALTTLVLDEADEMLDMGFAEDIEAILEATPDTRQTMLFSATMPPRLRTIAEEQLRDPERIMIAQEKTAAGKLPRVRQVAYVVPRAHKAAALQRVLDMESPSSALVFCRTRLEVDSLVETLNAHGYRAEALHGGHAAAAARGGDGALPRRQGRSADRHRRGGARPRHPAALARVQLRRAVGRPRPTFTASAAPAAPDARAPPSPSRSRASTGCCAASSA